MRGSYILLRQIVPFGYQLMSKSLKTSVYRNSFVFESSKPKLKMAKDMMQVPPYDQDHPMLKKQIPLAIMECKSPDTINVGKYTTLHTYDDTCIWLSTLDQFLKKLIFVQDNEN